MPRRLEFRIEKWPISGAFTISRGVKTEATVIVVEISEGGAVGRGECVPYARYGESPESVLRRIETLAPAIAGGMDRAALQSALPAGAARNALDCALWDLDARLAGTSVAALAAVAAPSPVTTAYTLSLDTPERMAAAARNAARPVLKLKLGAEGDMERLRAIRDAVPETMLIADANEGWVPATCAQISKPARKWALPWSSNRCQLARIMRCSMSNASYPCAPTRVSTTVQTSRRSREDTTP